MSSTGSSTHLEARADFGAVTEQPGAPASRLQIARLHERYAFAALYAAPGPVLEVACGAGIGLPLLAERGGRAIGGDIDAGRLAAASGRGLPLVRLDAQRLPFRSGTFSLVYLGEAIYYLPDPAAFIAEAARVLKPGGHVVVTSVNPQWLGWIRSPFSTRYLDARELAALLRAAGLSTTVFGSFHDSGSGRGLALLRRGLSMLNMIPGSLIGRNALKRLVYGRLRPLPDALEVTGVPDTFIWAQLPHEELGARFSILHAVGRAPEASR